MLSILLASIALVAAEPANMFELSLAGTGKCLVGNGTSLVRDICDEKKFWYIVKYEYSYYYALCYASNPKDYCLMPDFSLTKKQDTNIDYTSTLAKFSILINTLNTKLISICDDFGACLGPGDNDSKWQDFALILPYPVYQTYLLDNAYSHIVPTNQAFKKSFPLAVYASTRCVYPQLRDNVASLVQGYCDKAANWYLSMTVNAEETNLCYKLQSKDYCISRSMSMLLKGNSDKFKREVGNVQLQGYNNDIFSISMTGAARGSCLPTISGSTNFANPANCEFFNFNSIIPL